jgi:hypothetical protein
MTVIDSAATQIRTLASGVSCIDSPEAASGTSEKAMAHRDRRKARPSHQIGEARIASESVERGVHSQKDQLNVPQGDRLLQRRERLLVLTQCPIKNGELRVRNAGLARSQLVEDLIAGQSCSVRNRHWRRCPQSSHIVRR